MFLIAIIACFIAGHIQNDFVTPAFADIKNHFRVSPAVFHLISSSFSAGLCIGGLVIGAVADFFGYKKVLNLGLLLLIIANLLNIYAPSLDILILSRFCQGIGCSAPIIICAAIIFEHCSKDESRQLVGLNNGVITYAKSLAPIMGAYVNDFGNWKLNFLLLSTLSALAFVLNIKFVPEDNKAQTHSSLKATLSSIFRNYLFLLQDKKMILYIFSLGFLACSLITFTIGAPIIYIEHLSISKSVYGFHQAVIWFVFGSCCIINRFLIKFFQVIKLRNIAFILVLIATLLLNIFYFRGFGEAKIFTACMALYAGAAGILITIMFADAMFLFQEIKGTKSSLIASCRAMFVAIAAGLAGYFFNGTLLPLIIIITCLTTLAVLSYYFIVKLQSKNY